MSTLDKTFTVLIFGFLWQNVRSSGNAPTWFIPSVGDTKSIYESAAAGTSVYVVVATDDENDPLTYTIHSQTPSSPSFTLDPTSGDLNSPAGLDAETSTSFVFEFSVSDSTSTETSPSLTINIEDVNEFSPVFNQTTYTTTIYDTVSNGYNVLNVYAPDDDVTSSVSYSITDTSTFSIESTSGQISVGNSGNLNPSTTPSYTLTVTASDGTNTDTASVTISVLDDPCDPNPCQNSGVCARSGASFTCTCQSGWIGATCSTDDPCLPEPCENSGNCSVSGSSFLCNCSPGFSGTTCTDVTASNQDTNTPEDGLSPGIIAVICVVIITLVVLSPFASYYVYHKCLKRGLEKRSESSNQHYKKEKSSLSIKRKSSVTPTDFKVPELTFGNIELENNVIKMENG